MDRVLPVQNLREILNKKKSRVVCVSGHFLFGPHLGHLELIQSAKKLGEILVVIVNNDEQVKLKGNYPFLSEFERAVIMSHIRDVDYVVVAVDTDSTVCKTLELLKPDIFANGGDRSSFNNMNIDELNICRKNNIAVISLGGEKVNSSSEILKKIVDFYGGSGL